MQRGHGGQSERARPDDSHDVVALDTGGERRMHRTRGGLDDDRVLVGEGVRDGVHLRGVGHQAGGGPSTTRVGAEAGLQPGGKVAEGDVAAQAGVAPRALGAEGVHVTRGTAQDRFDHGAGSRSERTPRVVDAAVVEDTRHLVAGYEREAHHVLEVAGAPAVQGGQVGAADARQQGS